MNIDTPAGFWIRLVALFVDGIIVSITIGLFTATIYGQFFLEEYTFLEVIGPIYYVLLPVLWYGYTLGKRAMGIRISRVDGGKVGVGTMLLREIVGNLIYGLTIGIAIIVSIFMVVFREDKRAIHDLIANTYVTYSEPEELRYKEN
ncbi:RDD family protein [Alkalibacillus silvisoli]|uniref:RDD family protein n=1 Tax=Alkalibacillus silvisoli TaxID=392823 RepID=A0ABN0ZKW0_9BACI